MIRDIWNNRRLIMNLAISDFKSKYSGSIFGVVWAFIQPICTILVFWFVFQVGFKSTDIMEVPYILWFIAGLIPWFFFSEAWNSSTNCFNEYSFLVKKVVFDVEVLPVVKIISSLFVHIFFICFMMLIYMLYGLKPNLYWLEVIYYLFCNVMLVVALSYVTSALVIFFKDLSQIMNIILQFGMWLTPIMWSIDRIPNNYIWLFKLNPMYYIVQGYRKALITKEYFYSDINQTIYFWCIVAILLFLGRIFFNKLKPHFADVL